jgi:hypothetical protein
MVKIDRRPQGRRQNTNDCGFDFKGNSSAATDIRPNEKRVQPLLSVIPCAASVRTPAARPASPA